MNVRYSIGEVARRTGLKPDLIRAWERRYGAIEPERSATRRRGYSEEDIERLRLLRLVVLGGHSIGRVARLPIEELRTRAHSDGGPGAEVRSIPPEPLASRTLIEACLDAIRRLDSTDLDRNLHRAAREISSRRLIEEILGPLLQRVGELWHEGTLRPAHEHLASSAIRSLLGELRGASPRDPTAPLLLVTTPARQHHELGALMAAATASDDGWRVIYLGSDLPAQEIAGAASQAGAKAVALSLTYPPDDPDLADEIRRLRRYLPDLPIVVGGRSVGDYAAVLDEIGAFRAADFEALRLLLAAIRRTAA